MKLKEDWNELGSRYAREVNEMVELGEKIGWENWKGKEPSDNRNQLADEVFKLLKEANLNDTVSDFRKSFPPGHAPFSSHIQDKGRPVEHLHFIEEDKIVFMIGSGYYGRQGYLLTNNVVTELEESIDLIGKSKRNNVFAILLKDKIVTTQGWQGEIIQTFHLSIAKGKKIAEMIPFNDGQKVLLNTFEGFFLVSSKGEKMIHPEPDPEDKDRVPDIDMGNGNLSNNNRYIVVGDQGAGHRILNQELRELGEVGPQSSYPHYCIFSDDDSQLVTNSCHFYNGTTISVPTHNLDGLKVEAFQDSDQYKVVDTEMRVYIAITTKDLYIFGDAYGYIRAFNKDGAYLWRHFVGSTISGLTVSDDGHTVWVASYAGVVNKLTLGKGHRDEHTIGNGNHYEEFRLICWKEEPMLIW